MHMNIYVSFQNLNILSSFWSTGSFYWFFSSLLRFRIFEVDWFGPVPSSDNIDLDLELHNRNFPEKVWFPSLIEGSMDAAIGPA
jgi:hypothetical protein